MNVRTSIACYLLLITLSTAGAADTVSQTASLADLPAPVQAQIKRQLGADTLGDIEHEGHDEETSYIVNVTCPDGEESYFTVAEDGSLLARAVQLKELPANIQQAIKTQLGNETLDSIEKTFDEDGASYDVSFKRKDGEDRSFTLDSKGILKSVQLTFEEVPPGVRKAIEQHSAQGKPGDIYKLIEDGEISYSVELEGGRSRELVVKPDGGMESLQKFLSELPTPAQKTVRERVGSGKILRIDKSFTRLEGAEPFRVEARKEGKLFIFNVGPKGRYLGQED